MINYVCFGISSITAAIIEHYGALSNHNAPLPPISQVVIANWLHQVACTIREFTFPTLKQFYSKFILLADRHLVERGKCPPSVATISVLAIVRTIKSPLQNADHFQTTLIPSRAVHNFWLVLGSSNFEIPT